MISHSLPEAALRENSPASLVTTGSINDPSMLMDTFGTGSLLWDRITPLTSNESWLYDNKEESTIKEDRNNALFSFEKDSNV